MAKGRWLTPDPMPHHCSLPLMWFRRIGSRWQCIQCGKIYQITDKFDFKMWIRERNIDEL